MEGKMLPLCVFFCLISLLLCEASPPSTQTFLPKSQPATVPALPEQSNMEGCPLDLSEELFKGIRAACGGENPERARCCPVLAAWLYAAYARTALSPPVRQPESVFDMPILPDDSEMCVENLQKALKRKGIEIQQPNSTCDAYFCYCGIRLHRLSGPVGCPGAFDVSDDGKLVAAPAALQLEKDCVRSGVAGCSKCLKSLYKLNGKGNSTARVPRADEEEGGRRKGKMQRRECEMMGLTWLLAQNKTAYVPTVAAVLRAFMANDAAGIDDDAPGPRSCSVDKDGMPLAVDSSELDTSDASHLPRPSSPHLPFLVFFLWVASNFLLLH
ncbi:putative GPI-anchored protein [Nymphaea thermarum]|nr:putative GPI-anchored protein [Nymphaea thermarum]